MKDTNNTLPAVAPKDQHKRLVDEALPLAIGVIIETMQLEPYDLVETGKTPEGVVITERKFSARKNGQRLRAALGTLGTVEKLKDQALRRQAGATLKKLLAEIKSAKASNARTIQGESRPVPEAIAGPSAAP